MKIHRYGKKSNVGINGLERQAEPLTILRIDPTEIEMSPFPFVSTLLIKPTTPWASAQLLAQSAFLNKVITTTPAGP